MIKGPERPLPVAVAVRAPMPFSPEAATHHPLNSYRDCECPSNVHFRFEARSGCGRVHVEKVPMCAKCVPRLANSCELHYGCLACIGIPCQAAVDAEQPCVAPPTPACFSLAAASVPSLLLHAVYSLKLRDRNANSMRWCVLFFHIERFADSLTPHARTPPIATAPKIPAHRSTSAECPPSGFVVDFDASVSGTYNSATGSLATCYSNCASGTWAGCVGFSRVRHARSFCVIVCAACCQHYYCMCACVHEQDPEKNRNAKLEDCVRCAGDVLTSNQPLFVPS